MRDVMLFAVIAGLILTGCGSEQEAPLQPLGIVIQLSAPPIETLTAGDYLVFNTTLTSAGRNASFEIGIETVMQDKNTGKVLARRKDTTLLEGVRVLERSIQLPEDASGTIEVRERITFENVAEEAFFAVDVKVPVTQANTKPELQAQSDPEIRTPTGAVSAPAAHDNPPQPNGIVIDITIDNYTFFPQFVNITPGTTLRWKNIMRNSQSVAGPGFDSEPMGTGKVFEKTFYKEKTITYGSSLSQAWGEIRIVNLSAKKFDPLEEFFREEQ
ncbi:hypothetical protein HY641_03445 [Candidatus Woesearchaeota archaeon]|nr:hypothetical protein [Candidatus Woesearchaeota archaeon]